MIGNKINWNKYKSDLENQNENLFLNYLADLNLEGINRLSMVSFENNAHRESYKNYFLPTMEIKDYNVIID